MKLYSQLHSSDPMLLHRRALLTTALGGALLLAWIAFLATPFGWTLLVLPVAVLLTLAWLIATLWAVLLTIRLVRSGRSSWALPLLLFPSLLVAAAVTPRAFCLFSQDLGDELRFMAMRNTYLEEIQHAQSLAGPKLIEFDLGGMIWFHGALVYDESDEIALPSRKRSQQWNERAKAILECDFVAEPMRILQYTGLARHFYRAYFSC